MTDPTMALMNYLSKLGLQIEDDLVRKGIRVLIQSVIEAEVTQRIGAERYERSPERVTQRNGYRERAYATRVGEVTLQVPKLREGCYFPSFLEPRRKAEKALAGGGAECLRGGDEYPLGGSPVAVLGSHRHRQEPGQPHLQRLG